VEGKKIQMVGKLGADGELATYAAATLAIDNLLA
jgi:hypothetical protein